MLEEAYQPSRENAHFPLFLGYIPFMATLQRPIVSVRLISGCALQHIRRFEKILESFLIQNADMSGRGKGGKGLGKGGAKRHRKVLRDSPTSGPREACDRSVY
ncbi:hypothetical protein TNIN_145501 [Trichonephila inaurata madagascariensis]|uniref:Histone H4 n=1 Tax=Trichonephila inaurata madagascariensis TaxID=2747483 RepID=A0A8X6WM29_9ARAC|nr:hypothetical protein TNIN_145501 [Trichonephila inaurata madagascariensis]